MTAVAPPNNGRQTITATPAPHPTTDQKETTMSASPASIARRDKFVAERTAHLLDLEGTDENMATYQAAVAAAREEYQQLNAIRNIGRLEDGKWYAEQWLDGHLLGEITFPDRYGLDTMICTALAMGYGVEGETWVRRGDLRPGDVFRSFGGYTLLVTEIQDGARGHANWTVGIIGRLHGDPDAATRSERYPADSYVELVSETNATTTREISVASIAGGRPARVVAAGTRVHAVKVGSTNSWLISGPAVSALVQVDAAAIQLDAAAVETLA